MPDRRKPPLAILIAAAALSPLALNIFMPSMPGLVRVFNTDYATVQLALTLYLVGVAVGQLFYGPLSDRFGRRPIMLAGLTIFLVGSVASLIAPTIELLIAGRLVQAVGGCAGLVLGRAIVRDLYHRDRAATMLAYITMAMVVAPMMAPTIGGVLDVWFGWWASFAFVLVAGAVVMMAAVFTLHETRDPQASPLSAGGAVLGFARLLRIRAFHGYALQLSFSTGAFFSFLAGAPYVAVNLMGYSPQGYGLFFVMVSLAFMTGNFATARLSARAGIDRMVSFGVTVAFVAALGQAVLFSAGGYGIFTMFGAMAFIAFGNGLALPNGTAGAISVHPQLVGAASGLVGFMQMGVGAIASYLVGLLLVDSAAPMVWFMLAATALAAAAHLVGNVLPRRRAGAG